jgi:MFS family permease
LAVRLLSTMGVVYAFGFLSDAGMHQRLMGISAVTTSFANIFWGFAKDAYMLYVYAAFVGFASGGRSSHEMDTLNIADIGRLRYLPLRHFRRTSS